MAFFDNLGKKISVVAGTAADKAKDLGEIAKLKAEILGIQSDINAALLELGRKTYEQSKSEAEGLYAADCAKITGLYDQIESLRARIALVKSDNSDDNNCIINTDETPAESVEEQPTAEESSAPTVCPACGLWSPVPRSVPSAALSCKRRITHDGRPAKQLLCRE